MTVKALKKKNNMARKKTAFYKMKGHTLPGINQRMDQSSNPDGRAKSSAFQKDYAYVDYEAGTKKIIAAAKGGASKEEIRTMVQDHNKSTIGKKYKKSKSMSGAQINVRNMWSYMPKENTQETKRETNIDTKVKPSENNKVRGSTISEADSKRITDLYGYGPENAQKRSEALEIARENFARKNRTF